jgi:hypothetical protein
LRVPAGSIGDTRVHKACLWSMRIGALFVCLA